MFVQEKFLKLEALINFIIRELKLSHIKNLYNKFSTNNHIFDLN